jgi:hypothetical protein
MNPNCYECIYRGDIPGDAHSRCNHPLVKQDSNVFGALVEMLQGKNDAAVAKLKIRAHPHGITRGWFMWPANYDPHWLENCEGFTPAKPTIQSPADPLVEGSEKPSTPRP